MGKKGSSSVAMDPAIGESMTKMANLMEQQNNWYTNTYYPWLKQQIQLQNDQADEDYNFQVDNANWWKDYYTTQSEKQDAKSDELYNRYKTYFKPVEDQLVKEAKEYNTSTKAQTEAQNAIDTTNGSYDAQRQALNMRMKSYGIDTNSGLYSEQARASNINQAAAATTAANQARQSAIDLGWQKQLQLSQLGSGYLGTSVNLSNLANSTATTGSSASNAALATAQATGQTALGNSLNFGQIGLNSYQTMSNAWGQYGNMGQQKTNYNQQVQNAKDSASAAQAQGTATAIGTGVTAVAVAI